VDFILSKQSERLESPKEKSFIAPLRVKTEVVNT
jgi:hypothetical protein